MADAKRPVAGQAALSTQHLFVAREGSLVLRDLNLSISEGRWTAVVGPNGAGKSTLLQALASVLPHTGEICLSGQPIEQVKPKARARLVSWLDQGAAQSADDLKVVDVVMLGRLPHQTWLSGATEADQAAVERALHETNTEALRDRALGSLSAGERQRALLARLLAVEAEILLMDEPLANLDPPHQTEWQLLIRALVAHGKTVVTVLHELSLALYAQDIIIIEAGKLCYSGQRDDPSLHRALERVFAQRIEIQALNNSWVALPKLI